MTERFICPITKQIFNQPVIADDGIIYEESVIREWVAGGKNNSPLTGKPIYNFIKPIIFYNELREFLEKNPEYKKNQFIDAEAMKERFKELAKNYDLEAIREIEDFEFLSGMTKIENIDNIFNHYDIFLKIVNTTMDVNIKINGSPLISYACDTRNFEIIQKLLNRNVYLDIPNSSGFLPIHRICELGMIKVLKIFIERNVYLESEHNKSKVKPIHYALKSGNYFMAKMLIDTGVNMECYTDTNWYPIHYAAKHQNGLMMKWFIEKYPNMLNYSTKASSKPIHLACENEKYNGPAIKLIEHGVDIEVELKNKKRPIHIACGNGNYEIVAALIKAGAKINVETQNGFYPIHYAIDANKNSTEIIKLLIENGADVNIFSKEYTSPLIYAIHRQLYNTDNIKLLIENGADVNYCNNGYNSITFAIGWEFDEEIIKLLIENGADIHVNNMNDLKPIHCIKNVGTLNILIEAGADIETEDCLKMRPIHKAVFDDNYEVTKALIEAGAKINTESDMGTPLDLASDLQIKELLKKHGAKSGIDPMGDPMDEI